MWNVIAINRIIAYNIKINKNMTKKRNILEEEKLKRADVLALDIPAISSSALAKVEQYNQLKKNMQSEILRLKPIIDDLSYLFNIGAVDERKELQSKISKLEWAVYQMKHCS
jgi:hypothetical protein